jgi:hypothetical protein
VVTDEYFSRDKFFNTLEMVSGYIAVYYLGLFWSDGTALTEQGEKLIVPVGNNGDR